VCFVRSRNLALSDTFQAIEPLACQLASALASAILMRKYEHVNKIPLDELAAGECRTYYENFKKFKKDFITARFLIVCAVTINGEEMDDFCEIFSTQLPVHKQSKHAQSNDLLSKCDWYVKNRSNIKFRRMF
jgi:hypothetical protein